MDDELTIEDYKEVFDDHKRLVRELDVLINGRHGAAKQASLCDIVGQLTNHPLRWSDKQVKELLKQQRQNCSDSLDKTHFTINDVLYIRADDITSAKEPLHFIIATKPPEENGTEQ